MAPQWPSRSRGVSLASGRLRRSPVSERRSALRVLGRAGLNSEEVRLFVDHLRTRFPLEEEQASHLSAIAEFLTAIGRRAAKDYVRAVRETGAFDRLTSPEVLEFARSVDPHTAEWYFWAMWGTRAVSELTAEPFLRESEFFRAIGGPAVVEYFVALRETGAVQALTDPALLAFARELGPDAAVEFFGSLWETKEVPALIDARVRAFALSLDLDSAKEYFLAVRESRNVRALTDMRVMLFVEGEGRKVALDYFRALRRTRAVERLTDEPVRLFAESIGRPCARAYFQVLASTRATSELTSESFLRMAGVIRSIGPDAAIDYFLAAAARPEAESVAVDRTEKGPSATGDGGVPVLTLLDIPTYVGYRAAALVGITALFWGAFWWAAPAAYGLSSLLLVVSGGLAAWAVLLAAIYLLVGRIAERSAAEFLHRRRRLLNEHGIRWHDCGTTDRRCPLCWRPDHTHADGRFDCERFCRCPAC